MIKINTIFRTGIIYIEVAFSAVMQLFGKFKPTSVIPEGMYCYTFNGDDGYTETGLPYHGADICKYYRKNECVSACTYVGFAGWDVCLSDQCKICGTNRGKYDDENYDDNLLDAKADLVSEFIKGYQDAEKTNKK